MAAAVLALGSVVGVVLIALLLLSLTAPAWRIWPTQGDKSWQGYVWWPLFRGLNLLCFGSALIDRTPYLGLPVALRVLFGVLLLVSIGVFVYAFRVLGRDNSYCAADGLVTSGIYQWSRNPQNAMLVLVYGCLALAADSFSTYVLSAMMMTVYVLMVLCEEPWLERHYGDPYRRYCREVGRFFNWRRMFERG
jgi:protein-S-isoprenylcysteine O-methyltransferase Ste14